MLTLEQTKDDGKIESLLGTKEVRRRCLGGFTDTPNIRECVQNPHNVFLLAKDGEKEVGFVCLFQVRPGGYAIHLALRTVGQKTKDFTGMGILYAKQVLHSDSVYAIYPKSARAVNALCRHFQFTPNPALEDALNKETPVPYNCEILKLS